MPPSGFLLLRSSDAWRFACGLLLMGVAHAVITVKGTHMASHGALSQSPAANRFWALFFIEVRFLMTMVSLFQNEWLAGITASKNASRRRI